MYEDRMVNTIGFVESEEEAKRICEALRRRMKEVLIEKRELRDRCNRERSSCNRQCPNCEIHKRLDEIYDEFEIMTPDYGVAYFRVENVSNKY